MLARKIILLLPLLFFYASSQGYALDYIPVVLQWEPVEGADAYLLYYGDDSRHNPDNANPYNGTEAMKEEEEVWIKDDSPIEVGNVPQFTIQIPNNEAYFFAVKTVDNDQDYPYSDFSNEEATLCITWPTGGFYVNEWNDSPYTVRGRADANTQITLSDENDNTWTAYAGSDRNWSVDDVNFESLYGKSDQYVTFSVESEAVTVSVTATYDVTDPTSKAISATDTGTFVTITWTAFDATSKVASVVLWSKGPNDSNWQFHTKIIGVDLQGGTFSYTPTQGDGIYYFATRSVDKAGNEETDLDPVITVNYIASINTGPTAKEVGGGGCFITTAAPDLVSGQ